jgi:hypothetical protein
MNDDDPVPLSDAPALFPQARYTVSGLRAEASRGKLRIWRIGRRDYTSKAAMREMDQLCRASSPQGSISTPADGASETEHVRFALDALRMTAQERRRNSQSTSPANTDPRLDRTH